MVTKPHATVQDLYSVPENGKAEIVDGEIVRMSPTGRRPGRAATKIVASLNRHEEEHHGGYAFGDNVGFIVNLPGRSSFSPDAAWHTGIADENDMDFVQGAPVFAVEVRSKNDYGPAAEQAIARKIADYFSAGTQVVWVVDLLHADVVKKVCASDPDNSVIYRRGDMAEAEPAVPGWTLPVDKLFE